MALAECEDDEHQDDSGYDSCRNHHVEELRLIITFLCLGQLLSGRVVIDKEDWQIKAKQDTEYIHLGSNHSCNRSLFIREPVCGHESGRVVQERLSTSHEYLAH